MPGAGIRPGTRNRHNQLKDELAKYGISEELGTYTSPFKVMHEIMTNDVKALGLPPGFNLPVELRNNAAKELASYQLPKLKSIEHTSGSGLMTPVVMICADEKALIKLEKEVEALGLDETEDGAS